MMPTVRESPGWAHSTALQEELLGPMLYTDPDEIFGAPPPCDLQSEFDILLLLLLLLLLLYVHTQPTSTH
jgi:hypothetical protein